MGMGLSRTWLAQAATSFQQLHSSMLCKGKYIKQSYACLTLRRAAVWPSPDPTPSSPRTHLRPKSSQATSEYPTRSINSHVSRTLIGLVNASAGFVFSQTFDEQMIPLRTTSWGQRKRTSQCRIFPTPCLEAIARATSASILGVSWAFQHEVNEERLRFEGLHGSFPGGMKLSVAAGQRD